MNVPWARTGSGFTLMFEAFAMALIEREMPVNRVAQTLGVNTQRVWTLFNYWIDKASQNDNPSTITKLGVDETSSRKGHKYVTLGVDLQEARMIHACEGKGKETRRWCIKHKKRVNCRIVGLLGCVYHGNASNITCKQCIV